MLPTSYGSSVISGGVPVAVFGGGGSWRRHAATARTTRPAATMRRTD